MKMILVWRQSGEVGDRALAVRVGEEMRGDDECDISELSHADIWVRRVTRACVTKSRSALSSSLRYIHFIPL